MRFDIVPINSAYSGVDRSLTPNDFLTSETKPYYDSLLDMYFSYLDLTCDPCKSLDYDEKLFCRVRNFYEFFCKNHVSCELIVFDITPIDSIYGVPIKLLGIDIVRDMAESLISYDQQTDISIKRYLNKLGLFNNLIDANDAIALLKVDDSLWKPCWVYKVIA